MTTETVRAPAGGTRAGLWRHIRTWGEFVRFSHTVFALPFALTSMIVAARDNQGWPGGRVLGLILLAMVSARTCAMAFNRIVDREFDRANPRTAGRHLPTGRISLAGARALCLLGAAGLVAAAWFLNPLCFYLSPVALAVICFYSWTKRFTDFTHVFLGLALALAPLGAWLAVKGGFVWSPIAESAALPLLLAAAVVFWLVGFDIIYALQDYEFDRAQGLRSLVVRWGPDKALRAAFLSHLITWGLLAAFGLLSGFRVAYFAGLIIILACLLLEHRLARRRSVNWIQIAFFRLNALISVLFLVVTAAEVILGSSPLAP
ncbi:MAG TPA: UbiA-like polyprenyltransferase [Methylomirabilota bacterium]|nr:UbiA-like polyprenyltransferase [Methylomirabilota bacterium]